MTATPPKPSLVKTTALAKTQSTTNRFNALLPTVPSAESPVTVFLAGTLGIGGQLTAPTSVFPAGAGYYGVWTAPDLNSGSDYTIQVECFGAGGGGGGGSTTTGGGGGGGGEYVRETYYPVKPGTDYAWFVGVPGSPGTANDGTSVEATAGGTGGTTIFDIAGTGVAGGVVASGGQGGDVGNTGLGGLGGLGSLNTIEFGGGAGGTNLPGGGGGTGGQGGTDSPASLFTAGLLSTRAQAWYVMNDASSTGQLNDSSGNNNVAQPGSYAGGGLSYAQPGAASQVPAYTGGGSPPGAPNPTIAGAQLQFNLKQLSQQSGYILMPGFAFSGSQMTMSGWVTPDPAGTWGNTTSGSRAVVAGNNTGYRNNSQAGVTLYFSNIGSSGHPNWQLNFYAATASSHKTISAAVPAVAGTPVYVVATFSSGAMKLYVNGAQVASDTASFSSVPTFPTVPYAITMGSTPTIDGDWFFGFMSNWWFSQGVLSAGGVTQAFSGSGGGGSTAGGAGGGASGGPEAVGGTGAAGSGSTGGAGGTPATQPDTDIGINTPASPGIAGATGGTGNSGITGAYGAGGGGAGSSSSPPSIVTVQVPFTTASSYCGTDAGGGAEGSVYNPVIQGTTGRLFTGGQSADTASGSKNSLLILPPNLAASLKNGTYTVLRVTLTVFSANPTAVQDALMQVGWSNDTFLPITYLGDDIAGSAGVMEIPASGGQVTADLTETQLGLFLQQGTATALVLGPGLDPGFAAYNLATAPDFYTAVYGPGATDTAGNNLSPFLTITYATSTTVQQGSPGGSGGILVTFLNQAQTLVGSWNSTTGIQAQGGQLTETSVVLGSANVSDTGAFDAVFAGLDLSEVQRAAIVNNIRSFTRLGAGIAGAPGIIAGYTAGTTTTTNTTPGVHTFTVPSGVTSISVQCWGAGAGGTGGSTHQGQAGGGAGAYSGEPNYRVTPGQVLSFTVGAGGAGDPVGTNSSPDGTATVFDSTHVAGNGVTAAPGLHYNGGLNYAPGGGNSGNTVSFRGGNGGPLNSGQSNGSGGGGSGGSAGNGGGGSTGGAAGHAGSGGGAIGGVGGSGGSGTVGAAPGAGGGGGRSGTSSLHGGAGADGQVSLTYASSTALDTSVATASGTDGAGNAYPAGVMTSALQVNGTTTTLNQMVSNDLTVSGLASAQQVLINGATSSTQLAVTGSGHLSADLQVDGNHSVGGQVLVNGASSAAAIAANGDVHATGTVQGDNALTTSGTVSGNGGSFSGQVIIQGASTTASLGAPSAHISALAVDSLNGAGLPLGAVSTVSGAPGSPSSGNSAGFSTTQINYLATLGGAINGLIARLQAIGVIP